MLPRRARLFAFASAVLAAAGVAQAAPTPADAERLFATVRSVCEDDAGRLWGRSLCGPVMLVDYTDRGVIANTADPGDVLKPVGGRFAGVLPEAVIVANTPTEWSGARWTQLVGPLPTEADKLRVLVGHELFHRIQPELGLTRPERSNAHLDTLEGRYLLQLEWRALGRALEASTASARRAAVTDALAFRAERRRLFPDAGADEAALEIAEGVPEYTGVRTGLAAPAHAAYARYDLQAFLAAPTFVRSFAYASGPAYGLLLDAADPAWRRRLRADPGPGLGERLATAMRLTGGGGEPVAVRARRYDDGALRAAETARDAARRERLAALRARLVDGPVLTLPLRKPNYQFNPQTLVPLEGLGTVYPTLRLVDAWGALEVESGGALVRFAEGRATVSAAGAAGSGLSGEGWKLTLAPGWRVVPGARPGDLVLVGSGG